METVEVAAGDISEFPASTVNYLNANAALEFKNSSTTNDRIVTMDSNLIPSQNLYGIVIVNSVNAGRTLTVDSSDQTFGDDTHRLKAFTLSGLGNIVVNPAIFTENIQLNVPKVRLGVVNANITFLTNTQYQANGAINGTVYFNGNNGTITVADGINTGAIYNNITASNSNGTVIFSGSDGNTTGDLGSLNSWLSQISFGNNVTEKGDTYADNISVGANKTVTFDGTNARSAVVPAVTVNGKDLPRTLTSFNYSTQVGSNNLSLDPAGKAQFSNAALINAPIKNGQLAFAGDVWLTQPVTGVSSATFGRYALLGSNFAASSITADNTTIVAMAPTTAVTGAITGTNMAVDLGTNQLQLAAGNTSPSGAFTINTIYNSATAQGGNIAIANDGKLDLTNTGGKVVVKLQSNSDINQIPANGSIYTVISSSNGIVVANSTTLDVNKVTLDASGEKNSLVTWSVLSYNNNVLTLGLNSNFAPPVPYNPGSEAARYFNDWGYMTPSERTESWNRLTSREAGDISPDIMPIVTAMMNQVNTYIDQRVGSTSNQGKVVGTGSDDDKSVYGLWSSPFFSNAKQKMRKGVSGYKEKSSGALIGFDGLVHEQLMFGLAYSRVDTKLSHQDIKQGDRTKGFTDIYSVYGLYNFPTNYWFAEGIASYGSTRIKNSEGRVSSLGRETAYANYRSNNYGGQLLAGYDWLASDQVVVTPLLGGRFSRFEDLGYTEYGTNFENLTVQKRKYSKVEGIVGLRVQTSYVINAVLVVPELHGYANYDFKNDSPIIDARLDGMSGPLPTTSWKSSRSFYIVGGSFTARYKNNEFGAGYNCNIADKYLGHQVTVKVRRNF